MKRECCRACGAKLSRTFVDLGMSPLANSYVPLERANEPELFYPLRAYVCESCFLVQVAEVTAPDQIFSGDYSYYSSYSTTWLRHAERYTDDVIARFALDDRAHVVEVASNDGYLLQFFSNRGIRVTGIEPAANCAAVATQKGIPTEVVFFGAATARDIAARRGRADLMVANNVLAHVPDLIDFIDGFCEMLAPNGVVTFEFQHLLNLIRHQQFDTIYHEHYSYLALISVKRVLEKRGLRVFDVQQLTTHGGSLRVFACPAGARHVETPAVRQSLEQELAAGLADLAVYDSFAGGVVAIKENVLDFLIQARRERKLVCGYGAPAKGNTLLNYCGVRREHIAFTVDLNPVKQNTLLPGSRIPVLPVAEIVSRKPDYVFIFPWNLRDEISDQMSGIREWGGRFVTAIPRLEIF